MPARCAPAPWASPARRASRSRRRSCAASGRWRPRWRSGCRARSRPLPSPRRSNAWPMRPAACTQARRVYCLGLRSCHAAAWHFHYMLSLLGDKTVMLDDAGGTGLDAIRDAGPARRAAGRQRRALCPRHHRRRALCGEPGRAGRGADRFGGLAARPDRRRRHPGGDREPVLLPHHDAAAGRGRDPRRPGRGPRRQQGAGGARAHRGAARRRSACTCRGAARRERP